MYDHFSSYNILLEFLTPILIHGVAPLSEVITFNVKDLWLEDRNHPWDFYDPVNGHFLHPLKWSDPGNLARYCQYHLNHLLNYKLSTAKTFTYIGPKANEDIAKWTPP